MYRIPLALALLVAACSDGYEHPDPPSPNPNEGERFYFSSDRYGSFEIWGVAGGFSNRFTFDEEYDSWWPRLHPSETRFVFYRSEVVDRPLVGRIDDNYSHASLWEVEQVFGTPEELIPQGAYGWSEQGMAAWSPDGTQLVMAARSTTDGDRWHLFVTDARGENPVRISQRPSMYLDPTWSPDGVRIACSAFPAGYSGTDVARLEVFVMDADGSNEVRLTDDELRDQSPAWSPDGAQLAFSTQVAPVLGDEGQWSLRVVRSNGGSVGTVLDDGNRNQLPRWSADGAELYFHRLVVGGAGRFSLARVRLDGSGLEALATGGVDNDVDVDWLPDEFPEFIFFLRAFSAWSVDGEGEVHHRDILVPEARGPLRRPTR